MRHFQGSPIPVGAGRLYYRRWVEEGLISEIENPFEAVKWQQVLGGEGFLRKLKDHWNQKVERPKNYGQKRNWSALGVEQVLERVSEHFQCDLERLEERAIRNNLAWRWIVSDYARSLGPAEKE